MIDGKETYNTYIVGDKGVSSGGTPEGGKDPVYGYSISLGWNFYQQLFSDKLTSSCTIGPMLGTDLQPVPRTSRYTGMLTVLGGMGVSQDLHAVATQEFVDGRGFLTVLI